MVRGVIQEGKTRPHPVLCVRCCVFFFCANVLSHSRFAFASRGIFIRLVLNREFGELLFMPEVMFGVGEAEGHVKQSLIINRSPDLPAASSSPRRSFGASSFSIGIWKCCVDKTAASLRSKDSVSAP